MRPATSISLLLFWTLVAHGLLLLNDGVYWDDWITRAAVQDGDWGQVLAGSFERGIPTDAFFMWTFRIGSDVLWANHVVVFALIATTALLVRALCREMGLGEGAAFAVAGLALAFPGNQTWVVMSTSQYVFYATLFLAATWLLLRGERAQGAAALALRGAALLLYALSFSLNSLLVVYYVVMALLFAHRHGRPALRIASAVPFLREMGAWLVLPIVYFYACRKLLPRHGMYAGYNSIVLSPTLPVVRGLYTVRDAILAHLFDVALLARPLVLVALAVATAVAWRYRAPLATAIRGPAAAPAPGVLLLVAFCLGFAAALPYALVGRAASFDGWNTRHALLLHVPVALGLVAIGTALVRRPGPGAGLGAAMLAFFAVTFTAATINSYVGWQARTAKDRSIMMHLAELRDGPRYSVFWVHDGVALGPKSEPYRDYEWAGIFTTVWSGTSRIGLDNALVQPDFLEKNLLPFRARIGLATLDTYGCQADLTIEPGPNATSEGAVVIRYLTKLFFKPAALPTFLERIVRLRIEPRSSRRAVHCEARVTTGS